MANWTILKEAIASVIKTNDNQEITGQLLQNALNNIITNVGENATFAGIATPTTNPGTPDGPVFYIATTAGSYSNFGSLEVSKGETAILQWNNGTWTKNAIKPMAEFESGIIYDVSANNDGAVFESLSTLLGSANLSTLIPTSVRRGGMSIRFIQGSVPNSDNKYVQYRLMADTFRTTESDWQGVDDEPTAGSENLVKSGGTYKYIRNTSVIDVNNISGQEPSTLEAALALVPNEYRKGFALMYFRANSVLQLYGFKSGNPTDEIWNTASYWVKYLNEQEVDNLISTAIANLNLDIKNTALINASEITNTELSLAETLPLVPDKYRKGLAFITVREGGSNNLHLYGFVSRNPTEQNWNNTANWRRFAREDEVNTLLTPINNKLSQCEVSIPAGKVFSNGDYHYYAYFNGQDSVIRFNAIAFKQDGDYLEIEFNNVGGGTVWSTVQRDNLANIFLAVGTNSLGVRGAGNTWIYINDGTLEEKASFIFKMLYQDGNILIYRDSELLATYEGQIDTYMCGFGKNSVWDYWKGGIGLIKINSTTSGIQNWEGYAYQLPNITQDNTTYKSDNGFLTEEQAAILNNSVNLPNMVVSYRNTGGVFYVYMRKPGTNIYFMLDLHHVINNDELVYLDIWRLSGKGQLCKYENGQFVNLNKNLLLGVENEFTMHFDGAADFTGGYHGDERIDTQGSFVKFFIDGKELSSAELEADFVKQCNSFYMLSNATLHETTTDGETPVAGHPVVGRHIKKTIFGDCGFTCENRVDFDFTAESLASKDVNVLFTGLVCVHKDCALNAYTDDYIIRDVSSGAEAAINIYDSCKGKVCFYNNTTGLSCVVDSHAIGENDDNLYIRLQDRANDSKYYRYATNNGVRTVTTGDKYLSKVKAKWDYKFEQE